MQLLSIALRCNVARCGATWRAAVQRGALRCNVARCGATWRAAVQQTIKLADRRADVEIGLEYDDEALRTLPWVLFAA